MGTKMMSNEYEDEHNVDGDSGLEKTEANGYVIALLHSYHICQH